MLPTLDHVSPVPGGTHPGRDDQSSPRNGSSSSFYPKELDSDLLGDLRLDNVHIGDVCRSPQLTARMQTFGLRDYFDKQGARRFKNLSLTFAAKQNPSCSSSFGSRFETKSKSVNEKNALSARAYRAATEALERDKISQHQEKATKYQDLAHADRFRAEDVKKRQHEMLFFEIDKYEQHVPRHVALDQLLPLEQSKEEEKEEQRKDEKMTASLLDPKSERQRKEQKWLLSYHEIQDVLTCIYAWTSSVRNNWNPLGIDRPTFCRFILDCGLVDQKRVPYFWAVSLFDKHAKPMRAWVISESDKMAGLPASAIAPFWPMVNKWNLVGVLDQILKKHFDADTKERFLQNLKQVVRRKGLVLGLGRNGSKGGGAYRSSITSNSLEVPRNSNKRDSGTFSLPVAQASRAGSGLQVPEEPKPGGELKDTIVRRDKLVSFDLVEPEVLKLASQFKQLFAQLQSFYSDENRHTTFTHLLQFCHDFQIVPRITSTYALQLAYKAAECLEYVKVTERKKREVAELDLDVDQSPRKSRPGAKSSRPMSPGGGRPMSPTSSGKPQSPDQNLRKTGRPVIGSSRMKRAATQQKISGSSSVESPQVASQQSATDRFASHHSIDSMEVLELDDSPAGSNANSMPEPATGQPPVSGLPKVPSKKLARETVKDHGAERVSSKEKTSHGDERETGAAQLPPVNHKNKRADNKTIKKQSTKRLEYVDEVRTIIRFGPEAFFETICKVAFVYLMYYGNSVQRSTTGHAKMVWLVTYVGCVFQHLRESANRRVAEDESSPMSRTLPSGFNPGLASQNQTTKVSQSLDAALKAIDPRLFTDAPEVQLQGAPAPISGDLDSSKPKPPPSPQPSAMGRSFTCDDGIGSKSKPPPSPQPSAIRRSDTYDEEIESKAGSRMGSKDAVPDGRTSRGSTASDISTNIKESLERREKKKRMRKSRTVGEEANRGTSKEQDKVIVREPPPPIDLLLFQDHPFEKILTVSYIAENEVERPKMSRGKDDGRDLNGKFSFLERSRLTPPPMGQFGEQLNERLQAMLTARQQQVS